MKKIAFNAVRTLLTAGIFAAGGYLLYRYEYFKAIRAVDNIVGALPIALILLACTGFTVLLWIKHTKRLAPLCISLAIVVALSAALFPNALRGNWWLKGNLPTEGSEPDISVYEPFTENSQTAKLGETSTLVLDGNLPVMDGALALYPVYCAIAQTVYDRQAYAPESVMFTNTLKAYDGIIGGGRDVIFVAGASESQLKKAADAGVQLEFTPIGKEAFVFIVGASNPVEGLSLQQIRNIYSGKTAKWRTLGWKEGGNIIAFQRPEGSGSQTGLQQVMGDMPIQAPQPLPDKSLIGSNSLMQQVSVEWKGVQPALGYSYRFFANTMYPNPDAKLLKIDGVEPSVENIKNGSYPFTVNFYAVTNGQPQGNTKKLIDWILSPQGQKLIEKCGYTPLK